MAASIFSSFAHKDILVILGGKIFPLPVALTVGLEISMGFAKTLLPFHQEHVRIMSVEAIFQSKCTKVIQASIIDPILYCVLESAGYRMHHSYGTKIAVENTIVLSISGT